MRKFTKSICAMLVLSTLLFTALFTIFDGGIASAHSLKTAHKVSSLVLYGTAPMYVDCSKGSPAVKALEIKDHYCSAHTTNAVGPHNRVSGPCGSAYIYGSGSGFGFANLAVGGSSLKGGILNVSYVITWSGGLAGPGLTTGTVFPFGSTVWSDGQQVLTGSGRITAQLNGVATLKSGLICTSGGTNPPSTLFSA